MSIGDGGSSSLKHVVASLRRLRELDWDSLYRHTGFRWEAIEHLKALNGAKVYSLQLSQRIRAGRLKHMTPIVQASGVVRDLGNCAGCSKQFVSSDAIESSWANVSQDIIAERYWHRSCWIEHDARLQLLSADDFLEP